MDFTNLNKACPKDSYPLPSIDALIDSALWCALLSFRDAYSGYNQIKIYPQDKKNSFHGRNLKLLLQSNAFWFKKMQAHM